MGFCYDVLIAACYVMCMLFVDCSLNHLIKSLARSCRAWVHVLIDVVAISAQKSTGCF